MTDAELIAVKRQKIKALKREIAELENGSIGSLMNNSILRASESFDGSKYMRYTRAGMTEAWGVVTKLGVQLFEQRLDEKGLRKMQANLTKKQKQTAAEMCDEIINIFNKYMANEYGDEYPLEL